MFFVDKGAGFVYKGCALDAEVAGKRRLTDVYTAVEASVQNRSTIHIPALGGVEKKPSGCTNHPSSTQVIRPRNARFRHDSAQYPRIHIHYY